MPNPNDHGHDSRSRDGVTRRDAIRGAVALSAGVIASRAPAGSAPPDPGPGRADDGDLRVATFNIRYGTARDGRHVWPNRRALVLERIRAFDADVIGLQEVLAFQWDELLDALPAYAAIGVGRDDAARAGEFATILVRRDRFAIAAAGTEWFSETPTVPASRSWGNDIPRIMTFARLVDRTSGGGVLVFNVHLDHRSVPSRERSTALLRKMVVAGTRGDHPVLGAGGRDEPVVVTGDFNCGPESAAMRTLIAEGAPLVDAYRRANPARPGAEEGTFSGFADRRDGDRIDHVLVTPGVRVLDATIDRTRGADDLHPSDHEPVIATLRVGAGQ